MRYKSTVVTDTAELWLMATLIKHKLAIIYADKGYHGESNRSFLAMNKIKDGIMRKDEINAKQIDYSKVSHYSKWLIQSVPTYII